MQCRVQGGQTREMASQILAAKMIPHLGVPGLAAAPPGKLQSHHDFLRLLWHHQHYQMKGFKGIPSICCTIDSSTKKARCREVGDLMVPWSESRKGCREAGSPCLLAKVKHNWEEACLPLKDCDSSILRTLVKIKADFDKKMKNGVNQAVISSLTTQTVNFAPSDWQKRILADNLTSAEQHSAKIAIMTDYLGPEGTRYSKTKIFQSGLELITIFKDLLLWRLRP